MQRFLARIAEHIETSGMEKTLGIVSNRTYRGLCVKL